MAAATEIREVTLRVDTNGIIFDIIDNLEFKRIIFIDLTRVVLRNLLTSDLIVFLSQLAHLLFYLSKITFFKVVFR